MAGSSVTYAPRVVMHVHIHDPKDTTPHSGLPEEAVRKAVLALDPPVAAAVLTKDCLTDAFEGGLRGGGSGGGVEFFAGYEMQEDVVPLIGARGGLATPGTHILYVPELQVGTIVHPNFHQDFAENFLKPARRVTSVRTKRGATVPLTDLEMMNQNYGAFWTNEAGQARRCTGQGEALANAALAKGYRFRLTAGDDNFFHPSQGFSPHYSHVKVPAAAATRAAIADAVASGAFIASMHPHMDFTVVALAAGGATYVAPEAGTWIVHRGAGGDPTVTKDAASVTVAPPTEGEPFVRAVYEHGGRYTWFQPLFGVCVHHRPVVDKP